jgi:hypothetical protein
MPRRPPFACHVTALRRRLRLPAARPLLLALALLAVLVGSACEVRTSVDVVVEEDGSGTVSVAVGLDEAALAQVPDLDADGVSGVADLTALVRVADLEAAGWTVTPPAEPSSGFVWIRVSKPFGTPDEANAILAEITGPEGPLRDLSLTRSTGFASTDLSFTGTADLSGGLEAFGDAGLAQALDGEPLGEDVAEIEQRIGGSVADAFRFDVTVDLPGSSSAASWSPRLGEPAESLSARSTVRDVPVLVLTGLAAVAGIAFVVVLGLRILPRAPAPAGSPARHSTARPPTADDSPAAVAAPAAGPARSGDRWPAASPSVDRPGSSGDRWPAASPAPGAQPSGDRWPAASPAPGAQPSGDRWPAQRSGDDRPAASPSPGAPPSGDRWPAQGPGGDRPAASPSPGAPPSGDRWPVQGPGGDRPAVPSSGDRWPAQPPADQPAAEPTTPTSGAQPSGDRWPAQGADRPATSGSVSSGDRWPAAPSEGQPTGSGASPSGDPRPAESPGDRSAEPGSSPSGDPSGDERPADSGTPSSGDRWPAAAGQGEPTTGAPPGDWPAQSPGDRSAEAGSSPSGDREPAPRQGDDRPAASGAQPSGDRSPAAPDQGSSGPSSIDERPAESGTPSSGAEPPSEGEQAPTPDVPGWHHPPPVPPAESADDE